MQKSLRRKLARTPELYELLAKAETDGWSIEETKRSHIQLKGPNGALIHTGGTPSDHRAVRNLRAQIRRAEALADQIKREQKCQSSPRTTPQRHSRGR